MKLAILSGKPESYSTQRLNLAALKRGHDADVLSLPSFSLEHRWGSSIVYYGDRHLPCCDALIPRICTARRTFGAAVLSAFERVGVFSPNSSEAVRKAGDEVQTLSLLNEAGIEIPRSTFVETREGVLSAIRQIGGTPVCVHRLGVTRPTGTILVDSLRAADDVGKFVERSKSLFLIQKLEPENRSCIVRAIVVGDRVIAAVRNDLPRSYAEISFGGPTMQERAILDLAAQARVVGAAHAVGLGVAGIDLLECHAGPRILNATSSPNLRSVERCTELDIAGEVVDYVIESASEGPSREGAGLGQGNRFRSQQFVPLKFWLGYQLLVDPHQPVEPLIRTFMDGYFGGASESMREYLRYLRQRIDADAQFKKLRDEPHKLAYLDLEFFKTSQTLFDEAQSRVSVADPSAISALDRGAIRDYQQHIAVERFTLDGALLFLWPWLERRLPAGETMPFDRDAVIQRYERGWKTLVSSRYSRIYTQDKNSFNADGKMLQRMLSLFRDSQLPEQFRDLPPRDVADFNWLTFSQITPRQMFIPDDEAVGGMTATFSVRNRIQRAEEGGTATETIDAEQHRKPLVFGTGIGKRITDEQTITIPPEDIPQDGKYHLYHLGRIRSRKEQ